MQIDSFKGIYNIVNARSIPNNALSDAIDVDIDDAGAVIQRPGYVLSKSVSITSAYSTLDQSGYIVSDGTLYRVLDDLSIIEITTSSANQFCDLGKVLFTNDGLRVEDDIAVNIKLPQPELPPELTLTSGTMPAGTYSACYCYRSTTGLESGSSPISSIELDSEGGIAVAPITAPTGYTVNVYLTDANGTVYYDNNGIQLNPVQILAQSFPDDVETIAYHDAKLFLSKSLPNGTSIVCFSKPYHPHLYDYEKDYLIIQGEVLAMASTSQGLVIGTDSEILVYAEGLLSQLAGYGVIAGRPFVRTVEGQVYIHSKRGQCVALPFANLTETKVSQPPGIQCSMAVVDYDGIKKLLVLTDGSGTAYNKRN